MLKINRKDIVDGSTALSLWPPTNATSPAPFNTAGAEGAPEQSLDSSSNAPSSSSKHDSSKPGIVNSPAHEENSGNPALSMYTTADQTATSKTIHVAAFEQGSGHLWGSTLLTLHNAMDACLQAGQVLVAVPEVYHQAKVSEAEATHVLSIVQNVLS